MSEINIQIHRSISFIKDNLTHVDAVVDKLIEKDVIPISERDSIISQKSMKEQIQSIIDVVTKKQKGDVLIAALHETKNDHVATRITSVNISTDRGFVKSKTFTIDNADSSETLTKITKELANLKEENKHLKTQQQSLRDLLNEKSKRLKELNLKYVQQQARCKKLENENENLKNEIKEMGEGQQEVSKLQIDIQQLELKLNEKDCQIRALYESLKGVSEELRRHIDNQKETTDKLLEINSQLKHDNDQLKKENEDIKLLCKTMSENVSTIMTRLVSRSHAKPIWRTGTKSKPPQTPRRK